MKQSIYRKFFLSVVLIVITSLSVFSQQTLWVGQTYRFDVTSHVMGMTYNTSWSTSGGYLSLSGSGFYRDIKVTQYFSGTAYVTCEWDYKLTSSSSLTHVKRQVAITCRDNQVSISPKSMTLSPRESRYVSYRHQYDNQYTSAANAYFQSADPSICTVSSSGEVVAKNPGTTYINVYSKISSVSPYCEVTVEKVNPTSIYIPSSLTMTGGETKKISPTLYPSNAQSNLSWESSNTLVAKVSNDGTISALQEGNSVITVRTDNGLSASCDVIVNNKQVKISSNIQSGLVKKGAELILSSDIPNSVIYYTTDGSLPTIDSKKYDSPIIITDNTAYKAIAICDGYLDSEILTLEFVVTSLDIDNQTGTLYDYQFVNIPFNKIVKKSTYFNDIMVLLDGKSVEHTIILQDSHLFILLDEHIPNKTYSVLIPENAVKSNSEEPNFFITKSFKYKSGVKANLRSLITGGQCYCLALSEDGFVYSWGFPEDPLGRNCIDDNDAKTPKKIEGLEGIIKCGATSGSSFALKSDGTLYAWGDNEYGELGLGNTESVKYPMVIQRDVKDAFVSYRNLYFIKNDGSLWASGSNGNHQLGIDSYRTLTFTKILDNVSKVAIATDNYCYVIKEDSSLWGCGGCHSSNYDWCLGHGAVTSNTFVKILENVRDVYTSSNTSETDVFAITNDLKLYGWGYNASGELGIGHKNITYVPSLIKENVVDFAAGYKYALAIDSDGNLWSWGDNEYGCLGIGNHVSTLVPMYVCNNMKEIKCFCNYVTALDINNNLFSWGDNGEGWYDNSKHLSTKDRVSPELILQNIKFMDSSVHGGTYNYAVGNNGCLWFWTRSTPKSPILDGIDPIISISIPEKLFIPKDNYGILQLDINPSSGSYKSIEWKSDNEDVVKCIAPGILLANNIGTTNVSVIVVDENNKQYSSSSLITVEELSGIENIVTDDDSRIEIYNLQGLFCGNSTDRLQPGVYIIKKGRSIFKVVLK